MKSIKTAIIGSRLYTITSTRCKHAVNIDLSQKYLVELTGNETTVGILDTQASVT